MTSMKCVRCGQFWSIHTLWPDHHQITSRLCPNCIPVVLERLDVLPLRRRPA